MISDGFVLERALHRLFDLVLRLDSDRFQKLADTHVESVFVHFLSPGRFALTKRMSPSVDESCVPVSPSRSATMRSASFLPSSTHHWSKELMSSSAPSTNTLCS